MQASDGKSALDTGRMALREPEGVITDKYGEIEVVPCWKWMLRSS